MRKCKSEDSLLSCPCFLLCPGGKRQSVEPDKMRMLDLRIPCWKRGGTMREWCFNGGCPVAGLGMNLASYEQYNQGEMGVKFGYS